MLGFQAGLKHIAATCLSSMFSWRRSVSQLHVLVAVQLRPGLPAMLPFHVVSAASPKMSPPEPHAMDPVRSLYCVSGWRVFTLRLMQSCCLPANPALAISSTPARMQLIRPIVFQVTIILLTNSQRLSNLGLGGAKIAASCPAWPKHAPSWESIVADGGD